MNKKVSKIAEDFAPLALSLLLLWSANKYISIKIPQLHSSSMDSLVSSAITFSAITIGFVSTSMAILASIYNSELMKQIRTADYSALLVRYLVETIISSAVFLALCFLYYVITDVSRELLMCGAFFGTYSFMCLIRVTLTIALILKKLH